MIRYIRQRVVLVVIPTLNFTTKNAQLESTMCALLGHSVNKFVKNA